MSNDMNINGCVMCIHGDKLYTMIMTGQIKYDFDEYSNGLKPFAHKPNVQCMYLKWRRGDNCINISMSRYVLGLGCIGFFACQDTCSTVFCNMNNLCNPRMIEKYHNTLTVTPFFWILSSFDKYLGALQCTHSCKLNVSLQYNDTHLDIYVFFLPSFQASSSTSLSHKKR